MSDHVIITGVRRARELVPVKELKQMCVCSDSRIRTHTGYTKANDIKIGDRIYGYGKDHSCINTVRKIFRHYGQAKKISFSNGTEIIASSHPLLTWEQNWVNSDHLKIGDKVSVLIKPDITDGITLREKIFNEVKNIDGLYCRVTDISLDSLRKIPNSEIIDFLGIREKSIYKVKKNGIIPIRVAIKYGLVIRFIRNVNGHEFDLEKIDYDNLGWVLGIIASDGNIRTNNRWEARVSMKDKEIVERIATIFTNSGIKCSCYKLSKRNMWECDISSPLIKVFVRLGMIPNKTKKLNLEKFINLSRYDKSQFISGYIDGDGSYDGKHFKVRICSASNQAAKDIRDMLNSLGIYCILSFSKGNGKVFNYPCDTSHWNIIISQRECLSRLISSVAYSFKLPKTLPTVKRDTRMIHNERWWTKVKKIEEIGERNLINFSVSGTNTFVCENIITHNCGRVGRTQDGRSYSADIILTYDDMVIEAGFENETIMPVDSTLADVKNFVYFLLPRIVGIGQFEKTKIEEVFQKTLAYSQNKKIDFDKVIAYLLENEGIIKVNPPNEKERYIAFINGVVSASCGFHLKDVKMLRDSFQLLIENGDLGNDACLAWALGNTETIRIQGDYGEGHREEISNFKGNLPIDYECLNGTVITSSLWWCILGNGVPGKNMATNVRQLRKTWQRMKNVLSWITDLSESQMEELDIRVNRGIKKELVPFFVGCPFPMSKSRAMSLQELGFKNWENTEGVEIED